MNSKAKPQTTQAQAKRFIEMAREIGADERPDALERALQKIGKAKAHKTKKAAKVK
jgi:hypothetical protein